MKNVEKIKGNKNRFVEYLKTLRLNSIQNKGTKFINYTLHKDALLKISEFLTLFEICKFARICLLFGISRNNQLRNVKAACIRGGKTLENDLQILRTIYKHCVNMESITVYKNYRWTTIVVQELINIFNYCTQLRIFIGWIPSNVIEKTTRKSLKLTKICIDYSTANDMQVIFEKCNKLEELIIRRGEVDELSQDCLDKICEINDYIPTLHSLSIRNIPLTTRVKQRITLFKNITHLEIIAGNINDTDLATIARNMPELLELGLCGNIISEEGLRQLARKLFNLVALDIMATLADTSEETCNLLAEELVFPNLNVLYVRLWPRTWRNKLACTKPFCKIIDFDEWKMTTQ